MPPSQTPALETLDPLLNHRGWWPTFADWLASSRSHRVLCFVAGIWLLNGFDLIFTIVSHRHGFLHEENPVARHVLSQGTLSIALYKIGLVLIGTYPLLRFRTARITELGALVVMVVYALVAVRWSVCLELYTLSSSNNVTLSELAQFGAVSNP